MRMVLGDGNLTGLLNLLGGEAVISISGDFHNLELQFTVGDRNLGDIAHLFAQQPLANGGAHGDLAGFKIGLALGHQGIFHLLAVGLVL